MTLKNRVGFAGLLLSGLVLAVCAPRIRVKVEGQRITFFGKVMFESGEASIKPKSYRLLDAIAEVIKDRPRIKRVRIAGHTDNVGGAARNLALSQRRAEAVRAYLVRSGISPNRLVAVGYGERRPIASNRKARGREKNRRVEFIILRWAE